MDSFSSHVEKKGSILWVMMKKSSILRVMDKKGSIIFEWYCWKRCQFLDPNWKKVPSPESQKFLILESDNLQEGSILCVILSRGFNSLSPSEECSILWANFENPVQFFWSHSKRVQFCESCSKRMFNSVDQNRKVFNWVSEKWVQFFASWKRRRYNSFEWQKRVQFFKSNWKKSSIHWVIFQKKCSILWVIWKGSKGLNSWSESYW